MLYKYVKGRLGNQMFQYAALRSFQKEYFPDKKIGLCFKKVEKKAKKEHFKEIDSLCQFNTDYQVVDNIKMSFKQKLLIFKLSLILFIYKYLLKKDYANKRDKIEDKYKDKLLKNNIICRTLGFTKFDLSKINKDKDIIFYGYFESPEYFTGINKELIKDFEPKEELLKHNKSLFNTIQNEESVCVSIRRGDFVTNKTYNKEHFICDENYFYNAIDIIKNNVSNPKFIIFSDDIEWVKNNMKFPKGTLFEKGTDPVWEKLRLMSNCKHFILSNSSFSWWSQFLSSNKTKIVVAPKIWNKKNDNRDLYGKKWILI